MESEAWFFHLNIERQKLSAMADGLPSEEFKAIRFTVGLPPEVDQADPASWPPGHPLHPDVCGLHWGWQGGYVFLAIEGHFSGEVGQGNGFSYHLARSDSPMKVELPVRFSGGQPHTLKLFFDLAALTAEGAVVREGLSTHSREGDLLAVRLKAGVADCFRVKSIGSDLFQALSQNPRPLPCQPSIGTRYPLEISQRLPKVSLPEDNPLTIEGVELGRRLFHDARLSKTASQSCASCHDRKKSFTDGRDRSPGAEGQEGRRSAMALVNLAWASHYFWDGRANSLRDQALMPIQDPREMNETIVRVIEKLSSDPTYPNQFRDAFGTRELSGTRLGLALEQFLLTLISQDSKFDRAARRLETLTDQEQLGLKLFITESDPARGLRGADCFHCHGGNLFTSHQFANNGLEERSGDRGRMEVTRLESDRGKFKIPTLRNSSLSAPYMHDGRFATLEAVVDHYDHGVRRSSQLDPNLAKHPDSGLGLTPAEKQALVAFLRTLTDAPFVAPTLTHEPSTLRTPQPTDP